MKNETSMIHLPSPLVLPIIELLALDDLTAILDCCTVEQDGRTELV